LADTAIQTPRPGGRARFRPAAAAGRWSLRGAGLLYLGLFILLPVAAILQRGYGGLHTSNEDEVLAGQTGIFPA
jgi:hypothetical protein